MQFHKLRMLVAGCILVGCAVSAGCRADLESESVDADEAEATAAGAELNIVAHEDDDLLFMSPDLPASIRRGNTVETVYLTAGDADAGEAYWRGREDGIRAAYARMAGVENRWNQSAVRIAGKSVRRYTLAPAPKVRVVFV